MRLQKAAICQTHVSYMSDFGSSYYLIKLPLYLFYMIER